MSNQRGHLNPEAVLLARTIFQWTHDRDFSRAPPSDWEQDQIDNIAGMISTYAPSTAKTVGVEDPGRRVLDLLAEMGEDGLRHAYGISRNSGAKLPLAIFSYLDSRASDV